MAEIVLFFYFFLRQSAACEMLSQEQINKTTADAS